MNRSKEIQKQIGQLQNELDGLALIDAMPLRKMAKWVGLSPQTVLRARNGHPLSTEVAQKLLPYMAACPCCGESTEDKGRLQILF